MEVGIIGLGRMGANMVGRLLKKKQRVVVWNRSADKVNDAVGLGAVAARDSTDMISKLKAPRIVWMMLPSGKVTEEKFSETLALLSKGDILIDGGNSNFHDSIRRNKEAATKGITFMDVGVSGGVVAAQRGYAMMAGCDSVDAFKRVEPLMKEMCIAGGFGLMGPAGSGHYVKMVHNAVEYGMMQAIAEGFDLLDNGRFKNLDLATVSSVWNHGCIVSSFLMEMTANALAKDAKLGYLKPFIEDNGEGRWSVEEAMEFSVPFTVNAHALFARYQSRDKNSYAYRLVAAMRNEFGGHAIKK